MHRMTAGPYVMEKNSCKKDKKIKSGSPCTDTDDATLSKV